MKSLFPIFKNKWVKSLVLIILLQQLLVAGGTYFLGEITRQFPIEWLKLSTAFCLFICIFLPGTIVHYWVVWCRTRACKSAQLSYLNEYIRSNYNQPTHWRNEDSKQRRHDIMCRGGQETVLSTVYFGDRAGASLVQEICQGMPDRVINLAGKTNIRELMALIQACDIFLTNDSGPMHIASALGTPLLALFGSTSDTATGPYSGGQVIHKHVECSPCYKRTCPIDFRCMTRIEVDEVYRELQVILKSVSW